VEDLDAHGTLQTRVEALVDHAHAAVRQRRLDEVTAQQLLAQKLRHRKFWEINFNQSIVENTL